ncbi:reverse transcriptase domain-containing protein [Streptomyces antimycoticus]|uniref:reverse transcriptase domain-containing protein n=1 Tax=Streptomyces antimycoticus TaxID=68175 RepID=UPI00341A1658
MYKIWNRMSSGSYFPRPVRMVEILKPQGGVRVLGVPTVRDRVAQTVVAMVLERKVESIFHPDSYGYRPRRGAIDAVGTCRMRCWKYDWVIDLDIKAFFDSVPWHLMLKAVDSVCDLPWVRLCVKPWLAAPLEKADGTLEARTRGTPLGSAVSPVLADAAELVGDPSRVVARGGNSIPSFRALGLGDRAVADLVIRATRAV